MDIRKPDPATLPLDAQLVKICSLIEAICSSLTELRAAIAERAAVRLERIEATRKLVDLLNRHLQALQPTAMGDADVKVRSH